MSNKMFAFAQPTLGGGGGALTAVFKYAAGDSLASGYTFARALAAYQLNSSNVWTSVATGVVRDAHYLSGVRTLLIEPSRQNFLLRSADLTDVTAWSTGSSGVGPPVPTANATTDPLGTASAATSIAATAVTAGSFSVMTQNPGSQTSAAKFLSAFLKGAVGGEQPYIDCTPDGTTYQQVQTTLTTGWTRWGVLTGTNNGMYCQIGTDLRNTAESTTPSMTFSAWCPQLEDGAYLTSPIVNLGTSLTRPADVLTYTVPGGSGQAGTLYEKFYDESNGNTLVEQVSALTTSSTFVPASGRLWLAWKFALGTQTLAAMQGAV